MKGNEEVITTLNALLADELTAISQYMVHAEICSNWGYHRLHEGIEKAAMDEMKHAEWLIGRIIFLEGMPIVSKLNKIKIGKTVPEIIKAGGGDEAGAIKAYNVAIALSRKAGDESTAELLAKIVKMEEGHLDWSDQQLDQIEQMGLPSYLGHQIDKEAE